MHLGSVYILSTSLTIWLIIWVGLLYCLPLLSDSQSVGVSSTCQYAEKIHAGHCFGERKEDWFEIFCPFDYHLSTVAPRRSGHDFNSGTYNISASNQSELHHNCPL